MYSSNFTYFLFFVLVYSAFLILIFSLTNFFSVDDLIAKSLSSNGSQYSKEVFVAPKNVCFCQMGNSSLNGERKMDAGGFQPTGIESHCSDKATSLGPGQKVVSFSLFYSGIDASRLDSEYLRGISVNLENMRIYYKGWVARIYTYSNPQWNHLLCQLDCENDDLFICDVQNLPILGDVFHRADALTWRFLTIGDPTVDVFVSRDFDNKIGDREASAVNQWLQSNKTYHSMRDHPFHNVPFLGGMWGAKNSQIPLTEVTALHRLILKESDVNESSTEVIFKRGYDQSVLKILYGNQLFRNNLLSHDSYFCTRFSKESVPFPTQRKNCSDFVGNYIFYPKSASCIDKPCPEQCRPTYGKSWIYC